MKDVMVIRDPETAKILLDKTRHKILHLLKLNEMSAKRIAKTLGLSLQAVIYHLKLLEHHGLVEVARTERRGNLIKKYYRASAKMFILSFSLAETEYFRNDIENMATRAVEIFGLKTSPKEFAELLREYFTLKSRALEEIVSWKKKPISHGIGYALDFLATMHAATYPEFNKLLEKFKSLIGERYGS